MSFLVMPPEVNSMLIRSGAGSSPMLEAASAWEGLAAELGAPHQVGNSLSHKATRRPDDSGRE
jgi:hypothetical protein